MNSKITSIVMKNVSRAWGQVFLHLCIYVMFKSSLFNAINSAAKERFLISSEFCVNLVRHMIYFSLFLVIDI